MKLPKISFVLYFISVISFITLSSGVLLQLNYPYADPKSGFLYKLHPSFYLSFFSILFVILSKRNLAIKEIFLDSRIFPLYLISILLLLYNLFILKQPLAAIAMTWICPAFLISLYFQCSEDQKYKIYYACLIILSLNSVLGLYEYVVGQRIVPQYYFSQSESEMLDISEWSFYRAEALYGHPLTATICSSLTMLALVIKSKFNKLSKTENITLILAILSLPAFGGRFPMAIGILTVIVFYLLNLNYFFRSGFTKKGFILTCCILYSLPIFIYIAFELGLFDKLLARMADDNGSAATRLVAVHILLDTPIKNLIFGDYDSTLFLRQLSYGTKYGIEVSWIGMILSSGLMITAINCIYLYKIAKLIKGQFCSDLMFLFWGFLIMITSGTGLASKSHSISIFLIFALFVFFTKKYI